MSLYVSFLVQVMRGNFKVIIINRVLLFYSTGQAWASVTTEGLLIYSLDSGILFDPFHLDITITAASVIKELHNQEYTAGTRRLSWDFRIGSMSREGLIVLILPD